MFKITENSIFEAEPTALPNYNRKIMGELYEDFYIVPVNDGSYIKNHIVQSGNFYIREYYLDDLGHIKQIDFKINPETLIDVTDFDNPIFVGCDLARDLDLTYYNGEYLCHR
jgi:hypothetical protein